MSLPAIDSTREDSRNLPYRDSQEIDNAAMRLSRVYQNIYCIPIIFISRLPSDYHVRSSRKIY